MLAKIERGFVNRLSEDEERAADIKNLGEIALRKIVESASNKKEFIELLRSLKKASPQHYHQNICHLEKVPDEARVSILHRLIGDLNQFPSEKVTGRFIDTFWQGIYRMEGSTTEYRSTKAR